MIASLACVLVSRLMFNLRDPREHSAARETTTITTATSFAPMSTTMLLHTLTNVDVGDGPMIHESRDCEEGLLSDAIFCGHYEDF